MGDVFRCGIIVIINLKALATDKVDVFCLALEDVGIDGISLQCLARSGGRSKWKQSCCPDIIWWAFRSDSGPTNGTFKGDAGEVI